MKTGWFSRPSTGILLNKPLLILIAVIISSSSFLLGYMAGKSNNNDSGKEIIALRTEEQVNSLTGSPDLKDGDHDEIVAPPETRYDTGNTDQIVRPSPERTAEKKHDDPVTIEKISETSRVFMETKKKPGSGEYTVQVGAFKKMKDASTLKSRLEKNGYNSYIERTKTGGTSLFKVRVGSFNIRSDAEKIVSSLKKKEKIDSFVLVKR